MSDLSAARTELQAASDDAKAHVREQLQSIDEGLGELVDGEKTNDAGPHLDRLRELEQKLLGLEDEIEDDVVRERVDAAKDTIAEYRDARAREDAGDE